jgi:hypothetical protein
VASYHADPTIWGASNGTGATLEISNDGTVCSCPTSLLGQNYWWECHFRYSSLPLKMRANVLWQTWVPLGVTLGGEFGNKAEEALAVPPNLAVSPHHSLAPPHNTRCSVSSCAVL